MEQEKKILPRFLGVFSSVFSYISLEYRDKAKYYEVVVFDLDTESIIETKTFDTYEQAIKYVFKYEGDKGIVRKGILVILRSYIEGYSI